MTSYRGTENGRILSKARVGSGTYVRAELPETSINAPAPPDPVVSPSKASLSDPRPVHDPRRDTITRFTFIGEAFRSYKTAIDLFP